MELCHDPALSRDHFAPVHAVTVAAKAKAHHRGEYGRTFDLHPALFALTFGGYMAYLGIMPRRS